MKIEQNSKIFKHSIKTSKKKFKWNKIIKHGRLYGNFAVRLIHSKDKKVCQLVLSKKIRKVYGGYTHASILYSEGFLGIQFTNNSDDVDTYKLSYGVSNRQEHFNATRIFKKMKPRDYKEEDLEFDLENKCLVIPVELLEELTENDFDFKFVGNYEEGKKSG